MANEQVRIQVRENSSDHDWVDVGHKAGDETVPVEITGTVPIPTGAATEAKQDVVISRTPAIAGFQTNHIDDESTAASVTYLGKAKDDGTYVIKKIDETSGALPVFTYATITNNPATATYSIAWTNRATLVYDRYETAF